MLFRSKLMESMKEALGKSNNTFYSLNAINMRTCIVLISEIYMAIYARACLFESFNSCPSAPVHDTFMQHLGLHFSTFISVAFGTAIPTSLYIFRKCFIYFIWHCHCMPIVRAYI